MKKNNGVHKKIIQRLSVNFFPCQHCHLLHSAKSRNVPSCQQGQNGLPCDLALAPGELLRLKYAHKNLKIKLEESSEALGKKDLDDAAEPIVTANTTPTLPTQKTVQCQGKRLAAQIEELALSLYSATSLLLEHANLHNFECPLLNSLFYYQFEAGKPIPMLLVVPKKSEESFLANALSVLCNHAKLLLRYLQVRLLGRKSTILKNDKNDALFPSMAGNVNREVPTPSEKELFTYTHFGFPMSTIEIFAAFNSTPDKIKFINLLTNNEKIPKPNRYIARSILPALLLLENDEEKSKWFFRLKFVEDGKVERNTIGVLHYLIIKEESTKFAKEWKEDFDQKYGKYLEYLYFNGNACHFVLIFTKRTPLGRAKQSLGYFAQKRQTQFLYLHKEDDILLAISQDFRAWHEDQKKKSELHIFTKWEWDKSAKGMGALVKEITQKAIILLDIPHCEPTDMKLLKFLYEAEQKEYLQTLKKLFDIDLVFAAITNCLNKEDTASTAEAPRQIKTLAEKIKKTGRRHPHGKDIYEPVKADKYHELHNASLFIVLCWCMVRFLKSGVSPSADEVKAQVRLLKMALNLKEKQGINGQYMRKSSRKTYKTKSREQALKDKVKKTLLRNQVSSEVLQPHPKKTKDSH